MIYLEIGSGYNPINKCMWKRSVQLKGLASVKWTCFMLPVDPSMTHTSVTHGTVEVPCWSRPSCPLDSDAHSPMVTQKMDGKRTHSSAHKVMLHMRSGGMVPIRTGTPTSPKRGGQVRGAKNALQLPLTDKRTGHPTTCQHIAKWYNPWDTSK